MLESGEEGKKFKKMIKVLECIATKEQLLENGFTNYDNPHIYFVRLITGEDNYPVSFSLTISAKTLKITEIEIIDE